MREPVALEHVAHVVDDEVRVKSGQKGQQIANDPTGGIELNVPADRARASDVVFDVGDDVGRRPTRPQKQVQTQRPHAAHVHRIQFFVRALLSHHGDTACAPARCAQRIEHAAIVGAVVAWLHDDETLQRQHVGHPLQLLQAAVGQRVMRRIDARILRRRLEHVHVRIASFSRHGKFGARERAGITHRFGR